MPGSEACWQGVRPSYSGRCEGDGKKKEERGQGGGEPCLSPKLARPFEQAAARCRGKNAWLQRVQ